MTAPCSRIFTMYRTRLTGEIVTPAGYLVRYVNQITGADLRHEFLTRSGELASKRYVVQTTKRRYGSLDAAIEAILKATKE